MHKMVEVKVLPCVEPVAVYTDTIRACSLRTCNTLKKHQLTLALKTPVTLPPCGSTMQYQVQCQPGLFPALKPRTQLLIPHWGKKRNLKFLMMSKMAAYQHQQSDSLHH